MARERSGLRWGLGLAGAVVGRRAGGRGATGVRRAGGFGGDPSGVRWRGSGGDRGPEERGAERREEDFREESSVREGRMLALVCTSTHLPRKSQCGRKWSWGWGMARSPIVSWVVVFPELDWI
jgi:hypothetical protein